MQRAPAVLRAPGAERQIGERVRSTCGLADVEHHNRTEPSIRCESEGRLSNGPERFGERSSHGRRGAAVDDRWLQDLINMPVMPLECRPKRGVGLDVDGVGTRNRGHVREECVERVKHFEPTGPRPLQIRDKTLNRGNEAREVGMRERIWPNHPRSMTDRPASPINGSTDSSREIQPERAVPQHHDIVGRAIRTPDEASVCHTSRSRLSVGHCRGRVRVIRWGR